ncbi:MAG: glycosyl hydrolase-related protein [Kiritimatiellae bacterium]|nr:glycosyl hydrolase-related protein [Kiritimatiellia bacterium]MDW8458023.1 glycoside hydrolase family 38 C-terminal domain-containing protein [Verrucomicrobiota bacterium]
MTRYRNYELVVARSLEFFNRLCGRLLADTRPLDLEIAGPMGRVTREAALREPFRPANLGEELGPPWSTYWLKLRGSIPAEWRDRTVVLRFCSGSEALLWLEGAPYQGLNWESNPMFRDGGRAEAVLPEKIVQSGQLDAEIEIACNGLWGAPSGGIGSPNSTRYRIYEARLALRDDAAWALAHDLILLIKWLQDIPDWEAQAHVPPALKRLPPWPARVIEQLNRFCNVCDVDDRRTWKEGRALLAEIFSHRNGTFAHRIAAVGHAHIDTAWLWPIDESIRKCARSFSNALRLADRHPSFRFACSQALHYAWIREHYPNLYAEIRRAASRGQWIPVGGSWVEPDFNLPSGESLVRQFLVGQRFFEREFGIRCRECWAPDAFGFPASLPQILRGAGIEYFLTQKLSWSQFNKPIRQSFWWEGLDGSRVLAHFPPANTYNAMTGDDLVRHIFAHEREGMDHGRIDEGLLLFGWGDGGGGPTEHMVEVLERLADVQGFPRVRMDRPEAFFGRLRDAIGDGPVHVGELYLEYHRGTYTTQAAVKRANRVCERLLRDVELLSAVASANGAEYPTRQLEEIWATVLTNQFHDILPGSSIREVYTRALQEYESAIATLSNLRRAAVEDAVTDRQAGGATIVNTLAWERRGVVELEGGQLVLVAAPPCGFAPISPLEPETGPARAREHSSGRLILENGLLSAEFDREGRLLRLVDRAANRNAIEGYSGGNRFRIFEDHPHNWDAWEIDPSHLEKSVDVLAQSAKIKLADGLRAAIEFGFAFEKSRLDVTVSLDADSPLLVFSCRADWRERHRFLKVEFPVAVRADEAAYEIQFGHVKRATHANTPFEMARFEVPAHFWCDLSEPGYGVALINDCKYGHAVHGSVMRLSLLRGPTHPDPEADQGLHEFNFALFPHTGSIAEAGVVRRAHEFNTPLLVAPGAASGSRSWFTVDSPHLILDTVKKAEDSDALILRLYECHGTRGSAVVRSSISFRSADRVNLLEERLADRVHVDPAAGGIVLDFRPFEILSIRLNK